MCNPNKQIVDLCGTATNDPLLQLISSSKWSLGTNIELVEDILGWINNNLEVIAHIGTIEVNVIKGEALNEFIKVIKKMASIQKSLTRFWSLFLTVL